MYFKISLGLLIRICYEDKGSFCYSVRIEMKVGILICQGCYNKPPQTGQLKITEVYAPTV